MNAKRETAAAKEDTPCTEPITIAEEIEEEPASGEQAPAQDAQETGEASAQTASNSRDDEGIDTQADEDLDMKADKAAYVRADDAAAETQRCPLCGIQVEASALTCPRCKSRMDAHPRTPFALADTFDAWDALGDEEATARMTLPFHTGVHTGPLPALGTAPGQGATAHLAAPMNLGATVDLDATVDLAAAPARWDAAPCEQPGATRAMAEEARGSAADPPACSTAVLANLPADLPADQAPQDPSSFVPLESKRSPRHVAGAVAAVLIMVAFLAGGAHLAAQANTLNQIDDARAMADIRADASIAQGSAANDFVEEQAYAIDSVRITGKEAADGGVDVHASVGISNEFFAESRTVTMHYRKDAQAQEGDGWVHDSVVESSQVRPTRGISHDDEQGISGVAPALESGGTTCTVQVPYSIDGGVWYAEASGTRTVSYAFDGTAWARTGVDETQTSTSYQRLIGTYGQAASGNGSDNGWDWGFGSGTRGRTQLSEFAISWVDDAAGTFGGWFAWQGASGLFDSKGAATGSFSGQIAEDGTLSVQSDGSAGSIELAATDAGEGMLALSGTVYTQEERLFGGSQVQGTTFQAILSKVSDEAISMPAAPADDSANADRQHDEQQDATNGTGQSDGNQGGASQDDGNASSGGSGSTDDPTQDESFWDWWDSNVESPEDDWSWDWGWGSQGNDRQGDQQGNNSGTWSLDSLFNNSTDPYAPER